MNLAILVVYINNLYQRMHARNFVDNRSGHYHSSAADARIAHTRILTNLTYSTILNRKKQSSTKIENECIKWPTQATLRST